MEEEKRKLGVSDLTPDGNRRMNYFMLVELETLFETGLDVLIDQVILFLLRQQRAPEQLWKLQLTAWTE